MTRDRTATPTATPAAADLDVAGGVTAADQATSALEGAAPAGAPGVADPDATVAATADVGRIARAGLWSIAAYAVTAVSTFGTSVVVGRALGTEALGSYSTWLLVLRIVPTLVLFGFGRATTQLVAEHLGAGRPGAARAVTSIAIRAHLILVPIPMAAVAVAAVLAGGGALLAIAVAVGVAVTLAALDGEALLSAFRRFGALGVAALAGAVAQVAAAAIGLATGAGWPGFIALFVAASAIGLAVQATVAAREVRSLPHEPPDPDVRRRFWSLVGVFGLAVALNEIVWGPVELFFLQGLRGAEDAGLYSAALRVASLPTLLPLVAARVLLPELSFLRGSGDGAALADAYRRVCTLLVAAAAPLALGGAVLAGPLLEVAFGDGYDRAVPAAVVLLLGGLVSAMVGPSTAAVLTGPRPRLVAEVGVIAAVVLVVVDATLVPLLGPLGAAIGAVTTQLVCVVIGLVYAHRRLGLRYPAGRALATVGCAAASAIAARGAAAVATGPVADLAWGIIAGGAVYLGLVLSTRVVDLRAFRRPGVAS